MEVPGWRRFGYRCAAVQDTMEGDGREHFKVLKPRPAIYMDTTPVMVIYKR